MLDIPYDGHMIAAVIPAMQDGLDPMRAQMKSVPNDRMITAHRWAADPHRPAREEVAQRYGRSYDRSPAPAELCVDRVDGWSGNSIVVAAIGRRVLPPTDTETAPSFLWFAAIQCIERPAWRQRIASYRTKPVERVAGLIGETQEATREPVSCCSPASLSSSGDFETGSS